MSAKKLKQVATYDDFKAQLRGAHTGQAYLYHRGHLATVRDMFPQGTADKIAALIYALMQLEYVVLYQKRDEEGVMCYYYKLATWTKDNYDRAPIQINRQRIEEAERLVEFEANKDKGN